MDTQPAPMPTNNSRKMVIFFLIAIVVLGVVLYTARSKGYLTSQQKLPAPTAMPTADPNLWMKVVSATGGTQFAQGDQISLNVTASSSSKDVAGYDVLINYDPTFFDVISTKSSNPNFDMLPFNKQGMISITGTKKTSYTGQLILKGNNLLSIVLKSKKKGTTAVSIQSVNGPEKTKMVDTSSMVLVPQLTAITLAVY